MKPSELLRTSTFRLALLYMVLFAGSVLLLLGFLYWSTVAFMARQADATIEAEIVGLAEQYRERGPNGLAVTITERLERDPDSSSVYLFASPQYTPIAGNLSGWPDVPGSTIPHSYELEYGTDVIEIQADAIRPGEKVVLLDDLLATGGTMAAAIKLLQKAGAEVTGSASIIELSFLNGREKLDVPYTSLIAYEQ